MTANMSNVIKVGVAVWHSDCNQNFFPQYLYIADVKKAAGRSHNKFWCSLFGPR
jgi:hypothetical protein